MFFFIALVLSFSIMLWGAFQGVRCFGSIERTADRIRELAVVLRDCPEGGSFLQVLSERLDESDPIVRGVVHGLERPFRKDPVKIMGRTGWMVDLDSICDAKRGFRLHRDAGRAESMPGILTGVGILFTFLGLTIGVFGLDPTDAEHLTMSVKKLLGGMSLAFLTSISGIGTALWWTWRHRNLAVGFDNAFALLAEVLHDKSFLILPEELSVRFLDLQAAQTSALDQLESTVHRAFVRALDQSGLSALKALMTPSGNEETAVPLGPVLSDIRTELKQLAARSAETAEINRKLNNAINYLAKQASGQDGGADMPINLKDQEKLVLETRRIIANVGEAHKIQDEAVRSIKDAASELKSLMESARTANADIIENHQLLGARLDLLEKHWQTYRDQIQSMQSALEKTLTGFGSGMTAALTKVHGEIDGLLAESLQHFSGALKEFQATLDSLALLARNDPSAGSGKKGSWLSRG